MDDDAKAADYLARMQIEISRIVTIMMEAHHDGMGIGFSVGMEPPYQTHVQVTKVWKTPSQQ